MKTLKMILLTGLVAVLGTLLYEGAMFYFPAEYVWAVIGILFLVCFAWALSTTKTPTRHTHHHQRNRELRNTFMTEESRRLRHKH